MSNTALRMTWFAAFAVIFLAFIAYSTVLPVFGEQTEKAWQWLLPNLLPPIGIVFGIEALARAGTAKTPDPAKPAAASSAGWALPVSLFYLAVLAISVFGVVFVADPVGFLNRTNYWLAPLLAFTLPVLGARVLGAAK